jgi:hypothetical protein
MRRKQRIANIVLAIGGCSVKLNLSIFINFCTLAERNCFYFPAIAKPKTIFRSIRRHHANKKSNNIEYMKTLLLTLLLGLTTTVDFFEIEGDVL